MAESDLELLQKYARQGAQDAFAELLRRHLDLVYSVALRHVRSPQLAEEVAQSVFLDLARDAGRIHGIVAAWLYKVARRTAIDVVRKEMRRETREQAAVEWMSDSSPEWVRIEPFLDEAMEALGEMDRTSVLLRFFENKSLREVGEALGASEDAAQKRVSRAVEQLRAFFSRRGVTVGVAGLASAISANAVQSSPFALNSAISTAALSCGATATVGAANFLAMTTLHKVAIASIIAAGIGTGIYEAHHAARLQDQILELSRHPATAQDDELARLRRENTRLQNELKGFQATAQLLDGRNAALVNDPAQKELLAWFERRDLLRQRLQQNPALGIPEIQELTEKDWLDVAQRAKLENETGFLWALSSLRGIAEERFARKISAALRKYQAATNGAFPTDVFQLSPYFEQSVNAAALQRWQPTPPDSRIFSFTGIKNPVITEREVVDAERDTRFAINSRLVFHLQSEIFDPTWAAFVSVQDAFAAAGGKGGMDLVELWPYATTPEQKIALEKTIRGRNERSYYGAGYYGVQ